MPALRGWGPALFAGLLMILGPSKCLWSQEEAYLYVDSEPLGARVFLDGKAQDRPTPLLLRELSPGRHSLRFEKKDCYPVTIEVAIPRPDPLSVALISREPRVYLDGASVQDKGIGGVVLALPPSALTLRPGKQGIELTPVFPRQKTLDGISFALPFFLGLTGILALREIYLPRDSTLIISPELAASALLGGGLLGWDIALQVNRSRFLEGFEMRKESWRSLPLAASLRFEEASQILLGGNFDSALAHFGALVEEYPDDPVMPKALFEMGRILFIEGDIKGAEEAYRRVAEDYPLPELHDRARKGLADCLLALGDKEGALEQLDLLTYNGSGLTREEVDLFRQSF